MINFEGVHLTIIKRFEFAEPVFQPEKLVKSKFSWLPFEHRGDYTFLGDARQIRFLIARNKAIKISGVGTIKPIRNPYVPQESFWSPFNPSEPVVKLGIRPELPIFPFRIYPENKISVQRSWLEAVLGSRITNHKVHLEMVIYPPGVSTVRLHLFVESKEASLDMNGLMNLHSQLNVMPLITTSKGGRYKQYHGVFKVFNSFAHQVASCILSGEAKQKEFPGYYVVYTLQGESVKLTGHSDILAKLLNGSNSLHPVSQIRLKGKNEDDILAVGQRASIIYIDAGLLEKLLKKLPNVYKLNRHKLNISKGRRCFRNNFTNSVELAYITEALIYTYKRHFNGILNEMDRLSLSTTVETVIRKYVTRGVLDPCAYGTLRNVILEIPTRLSESRPKDNFWRNVYVKAAHELGLSKDLEKLKTTTEEVYNVAVVYRSIYQERIADLVKNISSAIDRIIALAKAVPLTGL